MREIKFRAWIEWYNDEEMKRVGEMVYSVYSVFKRQAGFLIFSDMIQHMEMDSQCEIHWMQFTGLKDKNGKEIYEGDIVTWTWTQGMGKQFQATIVYENDNAAFMTKGLHDWNCFLRPSETVEIEVIGNIWETPNAPRPARS